MSETSKTKTLPGTVEPQPLTLLQRMHAVMADVSYVQKDERPIDGKYRAVKHDAVVKVLRKAVVEHGIVITASVVDHAIPAQWEKDGKFGSTHYTLTSCDVKVTFHNVDDKTDTLDVVMLGYGVDNQDKGCGKAISYAVKYALLKAFMLETGDDPDNNQGEDSDVPKTKRETLEMPPVSSRVRTILHDAIKGLSKEQKTLLVEAFPACVADGVFTFKPFTDKELEMMLDKTNEIKTTEPPF